VIIALQSELDFTRARFDGRTYEPEHDQTRLAGGMKGVYECMKDGKWRTLGEIEVEGMLDIPAQSISARLRDLRKVRFGAHTVERQRRGKPWAGLWEYKLTIAT